MLILYLSQSVFMKAIYPLRAFILFLFIILAKNNAVSESVLLRSTPEAQGISSEDIRTFVEMADKKINTMHSFMLVRHGHVVAECWWAPESRDKPHILWSLSKSFTSTAVGLAVAERKLNIDEKVLKFFPENAPSKPSANLNAMRVRDLLTMSTGQDPVIRLTGQDVWTEKFLEHPVPHKPGTHFRYNSAATYMLSAIVQKQTGEKVVDYLGPRLFAPLGISTPKWETSPQGVTIGGYGLFLRTEDIAKFGQLYLQNGKWNGKQIVPAKWIAAATSKQVDNEQSVVYPKTDWQVGYGFQFWQCRHDAYRGDGKDGQFCLVLPKQDAVIAMTADCRQMQDQLDIVWKYLLPSFKDKPLLENKIEYTKLKETLSVLKVNQ